MHLCCLHSKEIESTIKEARDEGEGLPPSRRKPLPKQVILSIYVGESSTRTSIAFTWRATRVLHSLTLPRFPTSLPLPVSLHLLRIMLFFFVVPLVFPFLLLVLFPFTLKAQQLTGCLVPSGWLVKNNKQRNNNNQGWWGV